MSKRKRKQSFNAFFKALPMSWRRGLWHAIGGGAWAGQLDTHGEARGGVVVYFVHPDLAPVVEAALDGRRSEPEVPSVN